MKLHAEVDGQKHEVEIRREDNKVFAKVDDRDYELEVSEPESNVFLLKQNGRIFEVFVTAPAATGGPYAARLGTSEFSIKLTDPKRLRGAASSDHDAHGAAEIRSAMPGKVVRILIEMGAEVEKGAGVIVVEAMKMQNELKAPKAGVVKEIRVGEGSTVNAGDVLVVVE
jgi:biotin carboxyl carrier protein